MCKVQKQLSETTARTCLIVTTVCIKIFPIVRYSARKYLFSYMNINPSAHDNKNDPSLSFKCFPQSFVLKR